MEDGLDAVEGAGEGGGAEVEVVEGEGGVGAAGGEVGLLGGPGVVGEEGVGAGDGVAVAEEALAQVRADEPGGAGDEALHGVGPPWQVFAGAADVGACPSSGDWGC